MISWGPCGHPLREGVHAVNTVRGCRLCWTAANTHEAIAKLVTLPPMTFYVERHYLLEQGGERRDAANECAAAVEVARLVGDLDEVPSRMAWHGMQVEDLAPEEMQVVFLMREGSMRLSEWRRSAEFVEVPEIAFGILANPHESTEAVERITSHVPAELLEAMVDGGVLTWADLDAIDGRPTDMVIDLDAREFRFRDGDAVKWLPRRRGFGSFEGVAGSAAPAATTTSLNDLIAEFAPARFERAINQESPLIGRFIADGGTLPACDVPEPRGAQRSQRAFGVAGRR